jgi:hypothetical protein
VSFPAKIKRVRELVACIADPVSAITAGKLEPIFGGLFDGLEMVDGRLLFRHASGTGLVLNLTSIQPVLHLESI